MLSLQVWNQIKSDCTDWFSDPQRVLMPLAAIAIATALFIRVRAWNRAIFITLTALALTYLALITPIGAKVSVSGLTLPVPEYREHFGDAIVILGRGSLAFQERTQAAAHLWQSYRAPVILTTGYKESNRLTQQLKRLGVAPTALITEPWARTTEENACFSTPLLQQRSVKRIVLITDQPHMLRSLLTFRSFGFEVIPYPIDIPSSLPTLEVTVLALREYIGVLSYGLLGRFNTR